MMPIFGFQFFQIPKTIKSHVICLIVTVTYTCFNLISPVLVPKSSPFHTISDKTSMDRDNWKLIKKA